MKKFLILLFLSSCGNYIKTDVNTNIYVNISVQTALDLKTNLLIDLQNAALNTNLTPQLNTIKALDTIIVAKCAGVQSAECSNYMDTIRVNYLDYIAQHPTM